MKLAIGIVLGLVLFIGLGWYLSDGGKQEYEQEAQPQVIVNEIEKEVFSKDVRVKAAQDARRTEVEEKAQASYDSTFNNAMDEILAEVLAEMEAELKAERIEAEKRTGSY